MFGSRDFAQNLGSQKPLPTTVLGENNNSHCYESPDICPEFWLSIKLTLCIASVDMVWQKVWGGRLAQTQVDNWRLPSKTGMRWEAGRRDPCHTTLSVMTIYKHIKTLEIVENKCGLYWRKSYNKISKQYKFYKQYCVFSVQIVSRSER